LQNSCYQQASVLLSGQNAGVVERFPTSEKFDDSIGGDQ
jgi:hypothetical protein